MVGDLGKGFETQARICLVRGRRRLTNPFFAKFDWSLNVVATLGCLELLWRKKTGIWNLLHSLPEMQPTQLTQPKILCIIDR